MSQVYFRFSFYFIEALSAQTITGLVKEKAHLRFAASICQCTLWIYTAGKSQSDAEGKFSLSGSFLAEIELSLSLWGSTEVKTISLPEIVQVECGFLSFRLNESNLSESELKARRISLKET